MDRKRTSSILIHNDMTGTNHTQVTNEASHPRRVNSGLHWILLLLRIQGMYRKPVRSCCECLYIFYQILIVMFFLFFACEIFYQYEVQDITFGPEMLTKTVTFTSYIQGAFATAAFMYGTHKHLPTMLKQWKYYKATFLKSVPQRHMRKYSLKMFVVYGIILFMVGCLQMFVYIYFQPDVLNFIMTGEYYTDYIIWIVFGIFGIFEMWIFLSFLFFITTVSGLIAMEFEKVRPKCQHTN